jgi:hypothetical protein
LVTDLVRLETGYLFYNDYRIGLIFLKMVNFIFHFVALVSVRNIRQATSFDLVLKQSSLVPPPFSNVEE